MLNGTLDDFTLPDVLRLIAAAGRTGRLDVARDAGSGRLFFDSGAVCEAETPGETRTRSIEDVTFDLMRWRAGEFSWSPMPHPERSGEHRIAVEELLAESRRRLEELELIRTKVRSETAVMCWAPQAPEGAVEINITPSEWRVLVLVDGRRSVGEVARAAGLDDLAAMKVLFGLASAGLVEEDGNPSAPQPTGSAESSAPTGSEPAGEIVEEDPFLADALTEIPAPSVPEPSFVAADAPLDRSTAARELSGLFAGPLEEELTSFSIPPSPPSHPRRVEDDDQVTRGLITRLIDGVKGL